MTKIYKKTLGDVGAEQFSREAFLQRMRSLREVRDKSEAEDDGAIVKSDAPEEKRNDPPTMVEDHVRRVPIFVHARQASETTEPLSEEQKAAPSFSEGHSQDVTVHSPMTGASIERLVSDEELEETNIAPELSHAQGDPSVERRARLDQVRNLSYTSVRNLPSQAQEGDLNSVRSQLVGSLGQKTTEPSRTSSVVLSWLLRCFTNVYFLLALLVAAMYLVGRFAG